VTTNDQFWRPSSWRRGVTQQLNKILRLLEKIMANVEIDQAVLDADGAKLTALAADIAQVIANGNLSPADQTTLQGGIDALTALDTLNVTPPAPAQ
jgi:hypothetical protein